LVIKAADGLSIDLKHIDQKSVSQTIDAMVQSDPNLAWLKEAEQRGDVDWRLVKEIHDSYGYSSSGLGAGAQLAIAIVMAAFVGPAALTALGGAGAVAAGGAAIATGAATNATVSFINNGGNLGAVFKDVTSSDALKGYTISGLTAGMTAGYYNDWTGTTTDPLTGKISADLGTWKGVGQFASSQGLQNGTSAALGKIMGQGGDLGDALQSTLFNTLAAASFNAVGDYTKDVYADGSLQKIMIHAMVGGLLAQVSGSDFKTGALAAGANEALVDQLNTWVGGDKNLLSMTSQLVGMLAAATQSDVDGESLQAGAWVADNSTQYNYLNHQEVVEMLRDVDAQVTEEEKNKVRERYAELDESRNRDLVSICQSDPASCDALSNRLMEDDPKLRSLAADLKARGEYGQAAVVGFLITNSNIAAGSTIATELSAARDGEDSRFGSAFAGALLGSVLGGMRPSGVGGSAGAVFKTNKEAKLAAESLGFGRIKETVHGGQVVYKNGNLYITRDMDGHNGGAWKMAASVKDLGSKNTRLGTYDTNLNRIGD
jgi:filamentous hemagglutinin